MSFRKDLEYLATFQCQHTPKCDEVARGGVCNSCWVRGWAQDQLKHLSFEKWARWLIISIVVIALLLNWLRH
jgi:hypothetical protein